MSDIGPTLPFHLGRAYGVSPSRAITPRPGPVASQPAPDAPSTAPAQAQPPRPVDRLVAARVPGTIDFTADQPAPGVAPLPFYKHPADRNAAATAINLGKAFDARG